MSSEHVHWHEGLFLRPHHLQMLQRHIDGQSGRERELAWSYPYGVIDLSLAHDALENHVVRFDKLVVILPSGRIISVPDECDLPSLDIKQAFSSTSSALNVYLALPLHYEKRANTVESSERDTWRVKRAFRLDEATVVDENTGEDPQPVLVRKYNAQLLLDGADRTDLEVMPLLRIRAAAGQDVGLPRQDGDFVPATLVLNGSPRLREIVRNLSNQIEASRKQLVEQMKKGQFAIDKTHGAQFEQIFRLRTLNKFAARLPSLVAARGVTPFQMYLELRELLADLAALDPHEDQFEVAPYNHDEPLPPFQELSLKIRSFLRGAVEERYIAVKFVKEGRPMYAYLTEEQIKKSVDFFLGVQTKVAGPQVVELVENANKFKLMPKSLVRAAIFGIKLVEERPPPMELPSKPGLFYFRLDLRNSVQRWKQALDEKALSIFWPEIDSTDFDVSLYMTISDDGT